MRKFAIILLCAAFLVQFGCGEVTPDEMVDDTNGSNNMTDNVVVEEYAASDFLNVLPDGYEVSNWSVVESGDVFLIAKNGEGLCPHKLMILDEKLEIIKSFKPFDAVAVEFGQGANWPGKLDDSTDGYPIAIDLGVEDIPSYFVKVFSYPGYNEVPMGYDYGFVPRNFDNIDLEGFSELVVFDIRWTYSDSDVLAGQPYTQRVLKYSDGVFSDETSSHTNQMAPGLRQFIDGLSYSESDGDISTFAISLMLVKDAMAGNDREGKLEALGMIEGAISRLTDRKSIEFMENILFGLQTQFKEMDESGDYSKPFEPPWEAQKNLPAWTMLELD
ncbi:MAG TPA: hypothetical protein PKV16_08690 [Caldisericia bacterium]|nr:hypothetical protein [Caldisericia bacterium]HPF49610.1 hypothetical protein [Caldisericia bacterium]HPI84474.1 hypothetical protein [Caldisericia bacterium]HPQ93840.1 hypothetical protein [Caldisericia bacterium]HRV75385.1 hypothetical protein [Caldisericia bacterium]